MYKLCLVIPTKVDTSQVPQQNIHWMPRAKAYISITCHSGNTVHSKMLTGCQ